MEKKYQVFVSSTYQDLIEERQKVIEALLGKNCFPVGMEYFPAANDDQFTVIKKLIDRCDYYILIIGGRYGSIEPKSRKSYTQLEFEYAISKGIPVASFYHSDPNKLPGDKIESTDEGKCKLEEFKKMFQEKLCDSWKEPYELAFKVNKSLDYLFENSPRIGWVKADDISSADANKEILVLKKENEELKKYISALGNKAPVGTESLCQGNDNISIRYDNKRENYNESISLTWNKIIKILAPILVNETKEYNIISKLNNYAKNYICDELDIANIDNVKIISSDFYTIKIQLLALGIIEKSDRRCSVKDSATYWRLTPYGENVMIKLMAKMR